MKVGAGFGKFSGSISIDVNTLNENINQNTAIGRETQVFTIGSREIPLPLHVKVVPITVALNDQLWAIASRNVLRKKRANMIKALNDYPKNKNADIGAGM